MGGFAVPGRRAGEEHVGTCHLPCAPSRAHASRAHIPASLLMCIRVHKFSALLRVEGQLCCPSAHSWRKGKACFMHTQHAHEPRPSPWLCRAHLRAPRATRVTWHTRCTSFGEIGSKDWVCRTLCSACTRSHDSVSCERVQALHTRARASYCFWPHRSAVCPCNKAEQPPPPPHTQAAPFEISE